MSVSKLGVRSCGYMRYHRFLFTLTVIASSIIYLQRFFFFIFTLMFEAIFLNMLFWHINCTQKYALTKGKSESFIVNKIIIITIRAQPLKDRSLPVQRLLGDLPTVCSRRWHSFYFNRPSPITF